MEETEENRNENVKKKHIFLKLLLILVVIFLILYIVSIIAVRILTKQILDKNNTAIIAQELSLEYGTTLSYDELYQKLVNSDNLYNNTSVNIYINNNLLNKDATFNFENVDNYNISIELICNPIPFYKNQVVVSKQIVWKAQDTVPPTIDGVEDKEITQGDEFDAKAGITVTDEVDGNIDFTIEGEYDVNTVGEYTLTVKAVDKSNNETTKQFKLTVKEKPVEVVTANSNNNSSNKNTATNNKSSSSGNSKNTGSSNNNSNNNSTNSDPTLTKEGRLSLARAEARRVVSNITNGGMTKLQKAEAICMYLFNNVAHQLDQSNESYKTNYGNEAYAALVMKIAACSGFCKAVTLMCEAAGVPCQHINANQWTHQWNKVQIDDGSWVVLDSQIGWVGGDKHPYCE